MAEACVYGYSSCLFVYCCTCFIVVEERYKTWSSEQADPNKPWKVCIPEIFLHDLNYIVNHEVLSNGTEIHKFYFYK